MSKGDKPRPLSVPPGDLREAPSVPGPHRSPLSFLWGQASGVPQGGLSLQALREGRMIHPQWEDQPGDYAEFCAKCEQRIYVTTIPLTGVTVERCACGTRWVTRVLGGQEVVLPDRTRVDANGTPLRRKCDRAECDNLFYVRECATYQKYCSRRCGKLVSLAKQRKGQRRQLCKQCRRPFMTPRARGHYVYCSPECRAVGKKIVEAARINRQRAYWLGKVIL